MDFNDGSPSVKITPKQLAIIAGGILIAVLILIIVVRLIHGESVEEKLLQSERETIEKTCEQAQDKDECLKQLSQQAAIQTGQIEFCEGLQEAEYDGCVWEAADVKSDAELCEEIKDTTNKQLCADTIYLTMALESGNSSVCDKIENEEKKTGCKRVAEGPVTAENCLSRGEKAAYCSMLQVALEANQKQDPRVCNKLTGDDVLSCKERVEIDDPDFDGLTTLQEQGYGSNPDLADTDGDGYKDGDEVAAGYNPNGPGKLE